jgi:thiamine biosynthesis lipoprotein
MGTVASLVIAEQDVARIGRPAVEDALTSTRALLEGLDRRFSHYRRDSDIRRWATGGDVGADAAAEIEHVLRECGRLHADSDGVFRARNPRTGQLDTAGFVKGYSIGRAAAHLRDRGAVNCVVGVGGDVHCSGRASADRPWRVAVQDPRVTHGVLALVDVTDGAVATSGTAERGEHIWSVGTPVAGGGLRSFTVVGPDIAEADAYATVGFAMGAAGMEWVRSHEGYRSLVVRTDGTVRADAALVSAA